LLAYLDLGHIQLERDFARFDKFRRPRARQATF
jgi:hypothetical protein